MCMELVGPSRAIRQAERALTETATEQSLRGRIGQRTSQRQSQRDRAARQASASSPKATPPSATRLRHGQRPVGRSGCALDELESAVSRVELQAKRAPLRLERMWGQQALGVHLRPAALPGAAVRSLRERRELRDLRLNERALGLEQRVRRRSLERNLSQGPTAGWGGCFARASGPGTR